MTKPVPFTTENTSVRRVPPSSHPIHTAGSHITTSTTPLLAMDAPKRVHNKPDISHNPMRRNSTCFDENCVDCIENTENTSGRRVPPSNHPVHTAGRRTTTSTAHLLAVDVFRHVHNLLNMSYNPTRRKSTHFDVDYIGNTEDTSVRRASTNLLTADALNRVYHPPASLYELKDRCLTHFDMSSDIDHQENDEDTSSRRVPSSPLPLAARCRIMTSATCPLAVDSDGHGCPVGQFFMTRTRTRRKPNPQ